MCLFRRWWLRVTSTNETEAAVRNYQQFHGLPMKGELDAATMAEMRKPRCGFKDRIETGHFTLFQFPHLQTRWNV
ncbi:peptidoglycan-binding domain-containing protein (plasmid) [Paenibacillus polymyxa]|uniref:peptidoglycan-binding domain-containing protein n=1 Tax=Paenibacillus polymyxa TaxID=1406 RepID=UPI003B5A9D8D